MTTRWSGLLWLVVAIGAVYAILRLHDGTPRDDAYLLLGIAAVYCLGILLMVVSTRRWTAIALGMLAAMTAEVLLYGLSSLLALGWIGPVSGRTVDVIRAAFAVGGLLLLLGLVRQARRAWRERMDGQLP